MLLTIHNLPVNIRYDEIKSLIQSKCGLTETILGNLMAEGTAKKVTVGVAEEGDAAILVRKINGIYLNGQQLYVEDARRKKASEQPYCSTTNLVQDYLHMSHQEMTQPSSPKQNNAMSLSMAAPVMQNYMNMALNQMYYTTPVQNEPYSGYRGQSPQTTKPMMSQYQQPGGQMDQSFAVTGQGNNTNFQNSWPSHFGYNEQSSFRSQEVAVAESRRSSECYNRPDPQFSVRDRERKNSRESVPSRRSRQSRSPPRRVDRRVETWQRDLSAGNKYDDRGQKRPFTDRSESFPQEFFGRNSQSVFEEPRAPPMRYSADNHNRGSFDQGPSKGKKPRWEETEAFQSCVRQEGNSQPRHRQERPERGSYNPPRNQQDRGKRPEGNWKKHEVNESSSNRMRHKNSDNEEQRTKRFTAQRPDERYKPIAKTVPKTESTNPSSATKIENRTITFRGQATSFLLKDMTSNPKLQITNDMISSIKAALRERIDIMMEGTSDVPRDEIVRLYRLTFAKRADRAFLNKISKTKKLGLETKADSSLPSKKDNQAQHVAQMRSINPVAGSSNLKATVIPQNVPADTKPPLFVGPPEESIRPPIVKLPSYVEGSKKKHQQTKRLNIEETLDPSMYKLEPLFDKVLNEEIDIIVNMFVEEFSNPVTEIQHELKRRLSEEAIEEFKWVIKLPIIKRLLNMKNNLLIRIFGHPKPPKRGSLEAFLIPFGAVSLKKSDRKKLYVATCDTYENYDRLCCLGEAVIDGIKCSFKPMYIAGVPTNKRKIQKFKFGKPLETQNTPHTELEDDATEDYTENDANDWQQGANDNEAAIKIESFSTDIGFENDIDSGKTDVPVTDIGSGENKTDIIESDSVDNRSDKYVKTDEDVKTDKDVKIDEDAKTDKDIRTDEDVKTDNDVKTAEDEENDRETEENNFISDINEIISCMDDDDDDDEDARNDVNFGGNNMNDFSDVDVKDLEDDDLEDY